MSAEEAPATTGVGLPIKAAATSQVFNRRTLKTSRYTTGMLSTSGWVPFENPSWHTVASNDDATAANADVEELLACHERESSSYQTAAKVINYSSIDASDDNDGHTTVADIPSAQLVYDSYFRHAGWTGCASLSQVNQLAAGPSATLIQPKHAQGSTGTSTGATIADAITVLTASDTQVDCIDTRNVTGDDEPAAAEEYLRTKKMKQAKAFFHPEEEAWLLLFHSKVKAAAEAGHNIKLPGASAVVKVFNKFFEDRVLKDERGENLPPRQEREEKSMKNKIMKMHTKIWRLRDVTRKLLEGKRDGAVFTPTVTEDELRQYLLDGSVSLQDAEVLLFVKP
ncbi:hypothetical protein C7974DRAFT_391757 [Boeremia exigua]|uniref:uncharacterized protein n=1 Tax=Boeremia exigua TaxID=749465 RepID=UPI001E8CB9B1|nr:uncharacterized protein C7974DRAFT_391757 [Boeremia exigua]KAH6632904.1 hypothetical protein C7974DRAFT_391757 [Boeremia exigua]